jgi:hypothetical protein
LSAHNGKFSYISRQVGQTIAAIDLAVLYLGLPYPCSSLQ